MRAALIIAALVVLAVAVQWFLGQGGGAVLTPDRAAEVEARREPAALDGQPIAADDVGAVEPERSEIALADAVDSESRVPRVTSLRGMLVDSRTDEVVPHFELEVTRDRTRIGAATTDADGRFVVDGLPVGEELVIEWIDHPDTRAYYFEHSLTLDSNDDKERRFELPIGPTYYLDLDLPVGYEVSSLFGRVSSSTERGGYRLTGERLRPAIGTGLPWIRFGADDVDGRGSVAPWTLDVVSDDGLQHGVGKVNSIVGVHDGVVAVRFEPSGALSGSVRADDGEPASRLWVVLDRGEGTYPANSYTDESGTFEFRGLDPGAHRLWVDMAGYERWSRSIEIEAGRAKTTDIVLKRVQGEGVVEGRVVSETGTYRDRSRVAVWGVGATKVNASQSLEWVEEGGTWSASFRFAELPAGEVEVHFLSRDCAFEVFPDTKQVITPDATGLEFVVRDDVPTSEYKFRVIDGVTGQAVEEIDYWWWSDGTNAKFGRSAKVGALVIRDWPSARPFFYALRMDGYAMAFGDENDFREEGGAYVTEVRLQPGWGAQFFLSTEGHNEGLGGITLAFDGVEVGPSVLRGRLPVSLASRPRKIEVVTPGWRIAGGNVDPQDGSFDDDNWWALTLELEKAD